MNDSSTRVYLWCITYCTDTFGDWINHQNKCAILENRWENKVKKKKKKEEKKKEEVEMSFSNMQLQSL